MKKLGTLGLVFFLAGLIILTGSFGEKMELKAAEVSAPTNFIVANQGGTNKGDIALNWRNVKGAQAYRVYRGTKESGVDKQLIAEIGNNRKNDIPNTKYLDQDYNLTDGKVYYYWVSTVKDGVESELRGPAAVKASTNTPYHVHLKDGIYKFTFYPSKYGLRPTDVSSIFLRGEMNDWNKSIRLTWIGNAAVAVVNLTGADNDSNNKVEYKWYVNGASVWTDRQYGGWYGGNNGENLIIDVSNNQFVKQVKEKTKLLAANQDGYDKGKVAFLWNDPADNTAGYKVYRSKTDNRADARVVSGSDLVDVNQWKDWPGNGLQMGEKYYYWVEAYDDKYNLITQRGPVEIRVSDQTPYYKKLNDKKYRFTFYPSKYGMQANPLQIPAVYVLGEMNNWGWFNGRLQLGVYKDYQLFKVGNVWTKVIDLADSDTDNDGDIEYKWVLGREGWLPYQLNYYPENNIKIIK